jgi:hypothetical protein
MRLHNKTKPTSKVTNRELDESIAWFRQRIEDPLFAHRREKWSDYLAALICERTRRIGNPLSHPSSSTRYTRKASVYQHPQR